MNKFFGLLFFSTLVITISCIKRDCRGAKPEPPKKSMAVIIQELKLRVDRNFDNFIDKYELRRYLDASNTLPWYLPKGFAVEKIFEALDYNPTDGRISEKELLEKEKLVEENLKYLQRK